MLCVISLIKIIINDMKSYTHGFIYITRVKTRVIFITRINNFLLLQKDIGLIFYDYIKIKFC